MKKFRNILLLTAILLVASLTFVGCSGGGSVGGEVTISYGEWSTSAASTYLVKNILETELNYSVTVNELSLNEMWQSVASGDADFTVSAWLPKMHSQNFNDLRGDIVNLGPNYIGTLVGLVVPSYLEIDNINDLNEYVEEFNGEIIAVESRGEILVATEDAIEEYELDFTIKKTSEADMVEQLNNAIAGNESIVLAGWVPNNIFNRFDLKILEDANNVFGGVETINTITREDFVTEHPEVNKFLNNFQLSSRQTDDLLSLMEQHSDMDEAAQEWIDQNRSLVDSWLK